MDISTVNTNEEEVRDDEADYFHQLEDNLDDSSNDEAESKIVWQAKDFSIREFQSMKEDGDLEIQPFY
ncbi:hypothetical protein J7E63_16725 [Bacillus sp. ISL-75]|uniref:hypothetical protein n=1 Tax=Bacillus sp. ISL-75 TaxID=2819137 RepID=UPI001BEB4573|nr:hypothetical protein [Bacillus sp. ISL-75]MBT2728571.1 hypothetical protein [Bacillus sp. ISL-75]